MAKKAKRAAKKMRTVAKKAKRAVKKIRKAARKTAVKKVVKAKAMPRKGMKKYKELLFKEREKIGGELSHRTEDSLKRSQRDASGDLSGYSYHMADVASDNYEMEFSLGRATDEQGLLYLIDEALKRIEEGTYGACLQCGKLIPKKRLAALPHSELCIDCQTKKEGK